MKKSILTILFVVAVSVQSFAHYLWIETAPTGTLNQEQEIKVFFGEYTYGLIEKVNEEAFSTVRNFTLWVLDSDGKKTTLKVTAKENYYVAYFTPTLNGTYTVLLNNDSIGVIDYTEYDFGIFKTHYHSVATFLVGATATETLVQNDKGIALKYGTTTSDKVKLQVIYKNKALAKNEVKVYVSDLWSKTLETDEDGFISFKLPWKTKYIVETTVKEEVSGSYKGKAYEFIWHCATTCIK